MIVPPATPHRDFISVRRRYVDHFFERHAQRVAGWTLDLGGVREQRRGQFDLAHLGVRFVAANLSPAKRPHVVCDAAALPFASARFDTVIAAELLEHVPRPDEVLAEIRRTLRPGGTLLITVPFLYRVHGDPHDYARYTEQWWREALGRHGFAAEAVERQGMFWSVMMDSLHLWTQDRAKHGRPRLRALRWLQGKALAWGLRRTFRSEGRPGAESDTFASSFTTGYGIVARRGE
jgi:SAM-dependent methyltransferase